MKKYKNLEERSKIISEKLLETIYLLGILEDFCESDEKAGTLVSMANKTSTFHFTKSKNAVN